MYLISACLCGVNCKYSGKNNLNEDCLRLLEQEEAILICPEQMGGLPTPRDPAEIIGSVEDILQGGNSKIITNNGFDVTGAFVKGAKEVLEIAKSSGVMAAILKEGSPSCGCNYIYDGNFNNTKIEGEGITCKILRNAGIEVISDEEYSEKLKEEDKLIRLSDYNFKRKNKYLDIEDDPYSGAVIYTLHDDNDEIITDLPPRVEKNMKRLVVSMAKDLFGIEDLEALKESTGFTLDEIQEILEEENK